MNEVRIEVENWRGLSAYEVAKKNGFNGTETEWLEQIMGGSISITVNGKVVGTDGNIEVLASDILMVEEGQLTVKDKIDNLDIEKLDAANVVNNLTTEETGYALDARQGRDIRMVIENSVKTATAALPVSGWVGEEPYTQTVSVAGVTADNVIIVSASTGSFGEYGECGVRCIAQAENSLTFAAEDKPENQLTANVVILNGGELNGGESA